VLDSQGVKVTAHHRLLHHAVVTGEWNVWLYLFCEIGGSGGSVRTHLFPSTLDTGLIQDCTDFRNL